MKPRLFTKYNDEIKPGLQKDRGYTNVHQVPRVEKIVVNMGLDTSLEKSALDDAQAEMAAVTGRKPVVSKSRKNISNFRMVNWVQSNVASSENVRVSRSNHISSNSQSKRFPWFIGQGI